MLCDKREISKHTIDNMSMGHSAHSSILSQHLLQFLQYVHFLYPIAALPIDSYILESLCTKQKIDSRIERAGLL